MPKPTKNHILSKKYSEHIWNLYFSRLNDFQKHLLESFDLQADIKTVLSEFQKNLTEKELDEIFNGYFGEDGKKSIISKWTSFGDKIDDIFEKAKVREFISCQAQIRYRQQAVSCKISNPILTSFESKKLSKTKNHITAEDSLNVCFLEKVRAISPGQAAVFYFEDYLLGGAFIDKVVD